MNEKTEQPTSKKLRDARKKGQVAISKEIASAALMIAVYAYFFAMTDYYYEHLQTLILLPSHYYEVPFQDALKQLLDGVLKEAGYLVWPLIGLVLLVGIFANFFQIGLLFSFESVKPSLNKINPASGVKKIFSMKNLIEFLKSTFKIFFISLLLYLVVRMALQDLLRAPLCGIDCTPLVLGHLMLQISMYSAVAFILVAVVDYLFQRHQHTKQLKMTKDEVKREYKEMEGDPLIKSKRKQFHQELMNSKMVSNVKNSTVVVTNPTHIAVALEYRSGETPLPVIRAKGEGMLAERIIRAAEEAGVPIMRNLSLAHALHAETEVDQYIPADLFEAVAEVIRWVQELENR